MTAGDRRVEIAQNLAELEGRISAACSAAGRPRSEVSLIAVTKTFPVADVAHLYALGQRDMGESRDQEAAAKWAELAGDPRFADLRWHVVGAVQTNKCGSIVRYASVVHAVDRLRLVAALDAAASRAGRRLRCLVQVELGEGTVAGRSGVAPEDVDRIADAVAAAGSLDLAGVMAVAPRDVDPRGPFAILARVAAQVRHSHPAAGMISAGMSGDLEAAVDAGATHLRVGTALLGSRRHAVG